MHPTTPLIRSLALLGLFGALAARAAVEEQIVGPATPDVQYVVSDRGGHVAAVTRKGSRFAVVVDGVAGPKVDAVVMPSSPWIDPRPYGAGLLGTGGGRHATDQRSTSHYVVFSHDGQHFAYLARQSQEWVLMEDTKEVLRMPAGEQNADVRLQFSGDNGRHLLFARATFQGFELWVDGQKWPGFFGSGGGGTEGTIDPLISPDGDHIAYVGVISRDKRALILDGRDAGYFGTNLQFTADSKHLISLSPTPKGTALLVDGRPMFTARQILAYYCAPVTNRIAAVLTHDYPDRSTGQFVLLDGKPVEATLCKNGIAAVLFSPDGRHFAAVCSNASNIFFVVTDGKKGQEYDSIGTPGAPAGNPGYAFSADSSRFAYTAHGGGKYFVVVNGDESDDAFDYTPNFRFSPVGARIVYSGLQNGQAKSPVVIDGKPERFERMVDIDQFDFSPDGSRYAYMMQGNYGGPIYVDGQAAPVTAMNFAFSSDGRHLAITGYRPTDNVHGLWVDGAMVYHGERSPDFIAFSADSQHVFWSVVEPNKEKPGYWDNVTYADGVPVARFDNVTLYGTLTKPPGYNQYTVHPGWQATGPSGLVCVGPVGDVVKRITITPTDTNLAALIAGAAGAKPPSPH